MASAAPTADAVPTDVPAKKSSRKGLILGVLVLLLAAGGGATWFFVLKPKADAEHAASGEAAPVLPSPAVYLALDPAFVVNLDDPYAAHYLQAEVQLMSRDPVALETARAQMPRIRNSLLMLFGQQKPEDLSTREGKEKLQTAALVEVQKVMQAETGKPVVEAVYFTSFVMQ
ncbi:MAG: flagellar basal body-associated FliL family protein [Panacagrimonas sp.]